MNNNSISIKNNVIFNTIKTVSSILFPLITFPYISRVLLPENVGKINFGSALVSWFSVIAAFGIAVYAIRECSSVRENRKKLSSVASEIFSINICTTILAYFFLFITLFLYADLQSYRLLIVIQSLSILAVTLGTDWLNIAVEDFKYITIRTVCFQFISLCLMFIFVKQPDDYIKFACITLLSSAGGNLLNIKYRKKYCDIRFTSHINWSLHFRKIFVIFLLIVAQTVYSSVDSIMLGLIHGDYAVGIYSTAYKASWLIIQVIISVLWVILPRLSNLYESNDYERIKGLLKKVLGGHAFLGIPTMVGVFMLSKDIVLLLAGDKYIDSIVVLKVLMISALFTLFGISYIGNCILLPQKKDKLFMTICCLTALLNIVLNYIFIPVYGVLGAAWTTCFSSFFMFMLFLFCLEKKFYFKGYSKVIVDPILGSLGIVLVCFIFSYIENFMLRFSLSILGSCFVYFFTNYLLGDSFLFSFLLKYRKPKQ